MGKSRVKDWRGNFERLMTHSSFRLPQWFWKYSNLMRIKYFKNRFQNRVFIKIENNECKRRILLENFENLF